MTPLTMTLQCGSDKHSCDGSTQLAVHAGVRQSLATVGSLVGSGIASAVFILSGQSYVTTFAAAAVPPVLALAWLWYTFRNDLKRAPPAEAESPSLADQTASIRAATSSKAADGSSADASTSGADGSLSWLQKGKLLVKAFKPAYWQAILVVSVLYFGRFDFAWVTLRAQAVRHPCCERRALQVLGKQAIAAAQSYCSASVHAALSAGVAATEAYIAKAIFALADCCASTHTLACR